jgi:NAD+ kinase
MKLAIIGNLDKPGLRDAVAPLFSALIRAKAEFLVDGQMADLLVSTGQSIPPQYVGSRERCVAEGDMLVAFGGDGTILAAARLVGERGTPILGVNLGKLGFLAEFSPEEIPDAVPDLLSGNYIVEERLVLEATVPTRLGTVVRGVNDIVVDKSRSSRLINMQIHIDGAFAVTYRGDGLIVSTPTGSTGYALSNGGPIVIPTSDVIGITPISPHTLNGRPLIVPARSTIHIGVQSTAGEVLLSADGQEEVLLARAIEIVVKKAAYRVRLVKRKDRSYFDVLRAKLFWGADARSV